MILSVEMNLKKPPNTTDLFWLSQTFDNSTPLCDPGDPACSSSSNDGGSNVSMDDLRDLLGDPHDPHALPMTLLYSLIFLTGVVGNACTCVVIARNRYMHTATNYYLFSLAVSDLLLLVLGLPQDITNLWARYPYPFGEVFCIVRGWFSETSTNASILTITAFTVERYLAICHPLKAHTMSRLSRAVKFVLAIWAVSGMAAVAMGYQLGVVYEVIDGRVVPESAVCNVHEDRRLDTSFEVSTAVFFVFPATLLCVLYLLIGLQLRRSTRMGRKHDGRQNGAAAAKMQGRALNNSSRAANRKSSSASRKDVIKMLVAVVVAFFVCWAPFHAQRIWVTYKSDEPTEADLRLYNALTNVSGVCYYVSATINPILYSILSLKFRHAFRDTLARCCLARGGGHHRSSLFASTLLHSKAGGMELTEDFTVVSETASLNGGRKASRLVRLPPPPTTPHHKISSDGTPAAAFDDASVSDYIDQVKETQA